LYSNSRTDSISKCFSRRRHRTLRSTAPEDWQDWRPPIWLVKQVGVGLRTTIRVIGIPPSPPGGQLPQLWARRAQNWCAAQVATEELECAFAIDGMWPVEEFDFGSIG